MPKNLHSNQTTIGNMEENVSPPLPTIQFHLKHWRQFISQEELSIINGRSYKHY